MDFPLGGGPWPPYSFPPWTPPWMPWMEGGCGTSSKGKKIPGPKPVAEGVTISRSHAHLHPQSHPFAEEPDVKEVGEVRESEKTSVAALRLRGLPFSVTVQDVLTFFAQHNVADTIHDGPNSAKLLPKANGRPSGQAVVQMRSRRDADVAQKALNHQYVGGRYIEVFVYGSEGADGEGRPDDLGTGAEAAWSEWSNSYANAAPWAMPWGNQNAMFSGSSEQTEEAAKDWGKDSLAICWCESQSELELTLLLRDPEQSMWPGDSAVYRCSATAGENPTAPLRLEMIKTVQFPQDVFRCAPEHIRDNQEIALTV
eukprot:Skav208873  [mRNA]  locus=scaffold270:123770:127654:- [translate_table: standard]